MRYILLILLLVLLGFASVQAQEVAYPQPDPNCALTEIIVRSLVGYESFCGWKMSWAADGDVLKLTSPDGEKRFFSDFVVWVNPAKK